MEEKMNDRFKQLRKDYGMSVREMSDRLNLSSGMISMYETGKRPISERTIKDVCREFKVNEEWFRFGIGEKEAAQYKSRFIDLALQLDLSSDKYDLQTKDMASELIELWMGLDKNNKQVLFDVIEQLKSQIKKD